MGRRPGTRSADRSVRFRFSSNNSHCHDFVPKRHPGIVVVDGEGTGLDPLMRTVLMFGTVSFMVLFVGLSMLSDSVLRLEETAEKQEKVGLGELMSGTTELVMAYGIMSL